MADHGVTLILVNAPSEGNILGCDWLAVRPENTGFQLPGYGSAICRNIAVVRSWDLRRSIGNQVILVIPFASTNTVHLIEPAAETHVAEVTYSNIGFLLKCDCHGFGANICSGWIPTGLSRGALSWSLCRGCGCCLSGRGFRCCLSSGSFRRCRGLSRCGSGAT